MLCVQVKRSEEALQFMFSNLRNYQEISGPIKYHTILYTHLQEEWITEVQSTQLAQKKKLKKILSIQFRTIQEQQFLHTINFPLKNEDHIIE